jgi:selenocysteine lyase/cysteine desulfurase
MKTGDSLRKLVSARVVVSDAKKVLSDFLGCSEDEVALCDSTTTGLNIFM